MSKDDQEKTDGDVNERPGEDQPTAQEMAQKKEEDSEQAKKEMEELEKADELPKNLEDWPSGPAKYETFGLNDDSYGDGVTEKLGPANLERHEDGSVSVDGEKVDNPEDYKGEPIVSAVDKAKAADEEKAQDAEKAEDGEN